jgi:hypothetical protein
MELIMSIVFTGAMGYLVTELNEMQATLKALQKDVITIQIQLDRRTPKKDD